MQLPTYLPPAVNHPSAINGECRTGGVVAAAAAHLIGLTCNAVCSARRGTSLLVRFEVHEEIEHDASTGVLQMRFLIARQISF